jgi:small-conductance mechanosensitive channel
MENIRNAMELRVFMLSGSDITVADLILVPLFIIAGLLLLKSLSNMTVAALARREVNPDIIQIVRRGVYVIGLIILAITVLDLINVPLTAFAFVSGAIAIGVGFGAQNIINNFISGWILMWERPIRINDFIEVGDTLGTVEEINTRSTRIRRVDGVHLLIPNSKLLEETVTNWTLVDRLLRSSVRVGVAYGSDVDLVRDTLLEVMAANEEILQDPPPQVIFEEFADSALVFDAYFWIYAIADRSARVIRSTVRFEIDRAFREKQITIAFPQRDIHVDGNITVSRH